jgi:flavodoxin I
MRTIHFICASTSGHTAYVVEVLERYLREHAEGVAIETQRAEQSQAADLLRGDLLVLGSGTWNTGGQEGQLNMHMHALLMERAADIDLQGRPITFISLGDERYYFRTRCTEHFLRFQREHGGILFLPPLILVNEPYAHDAKIRAWGEKLLQKFLQPTVLRDDRQS